MKNTDNFSGDGDESVAASIRAMGPLMIYGAENVRRELQRDLNRIVETMARNNPASLYHLAAFRELADLIISKSDDRSRLFESMSCTAGKPLPEAPRRKTNILDFQAFRKLFNQRGAAEKFMTDRMLAERGDDGELKLTAWGDYVLGHLEREKNRNPSSAPRATDDAGLAWAN